MRNETKNTQHPAARHAVARLEQLEDRKHLSGNHEIGINVNDNSSGSLDRAEPALKALGVTSVRLWYSVRDWNSEKVEGGLSRAIEYHNAGYDVTLTIAIGDHQVPSTGEVHKWFGWAASNPALKNAVDRWEIGNEVDSTNYFKGTLKQYVSNFLAPASEELHAEGEKVISAGFSWNPQDVQTIINYGALDMVDYIGFHPYGNGVKLQKQRITELENIVDGRKPLVATEWNVRGFENNKDAWATAVGDAYQQVHSGFDLDYYYCLFTADTMAGPGGLIDKNGSHNTRFYNSFYEAAHGVSTTPTLPGSLPPSSGGGTGTTGNSASGTETQIALYDATTDRVISGYTDIKDNQVIDLAKLKTHKLALVVIPSKKSQSVKMSLNGVSTIRSTSPYAYFGTNSRYDFKAGSLSVGSYQMVVTPYTKDKAAGTAYATRTLDFRVKDTSTVTPTPPVTPVTPPADGDSDTIAEVTDFTLVDAKTGHAIKGYEHITRNTSISLASLTGHTLALLANLDEDAKSVNVTAHGKSHIENALPYTFFGDDHGKLAKFKAYKGSYQFTATAYDKKNGKGHKGSTLSLTLKFV